MNAGRLVKFSKSALDRILLPPNAKDYAGAFKWRAVCVDDSDSVRMRVKTVTAGPEQAAWEMNKESLAWA